MSPGETVTVSYDNHSQTLIVVASENVQIGVWSYEINHLLTGHALYVKNTFIFCNPIDLKGHLIDSQSEINGGNYYMKINRKVALPI